MKRISVVCLALLLAGLLTACTTPKPPAVKVVHDGQLWDVPDETTGIALEEDAVLQDGTAISPNVLPTQEGECNVRAQSVRFYDGDGFFLVIIDGEQHLIELPSQ